MTARTGAFTSPRQRRSSPMRGAIAALCLVLAPIQAGHAQLPLQVSAIPITNGLQLELSLAGAKPAWRYRDLSSVGGRTSALPDSQPFAVDRRRALNVDLLFLNPVRYAWTVSTKAVDDPTTTSLATFATALGELVSAAGAGTGGMVLAGAASGEAPAAAAPQSAGAAAAPASAAKEEEIMLPNFTFGGLQTWKMFVQLYRACVDEATLKRFAGDLRKADSLTFFSSAPETGGTLFRDRSLEIQKAIQDRAGALASAATINGFRNALESARQVHSVMSAEKIKAEEAISDVRRFGVGPIKQDCATLQSFTNTTLNDFERAARHALDARAAVLTSLAALLKRLDESLARVPGDAGSATDVFHLDDVSIPAGKLAIVTLVVQERELEPILFGAQATERRTWSTTVQLIEQRDILVDVSPGLMFSRIRFPIYSADSVDGSRIIARQPDDVQSTTTTLMLNLYPRAWGAGRVRLLGQVGVGTSKQYPLLLAGMGLRLLPPVDASLVFGAAWAFVRDLSGRAVGDNIRDGEELEKSLTSRFRPTPTLYIGFQKGVP